MYISNSADRLTAEGITDRLAFGAGEISVTVFECVTSTNAIAKELAAQGATQGSVVAARSQTGGRGRMGRSFFSPEGTGIYLSLLLRPDVSAGPVTDITTLAAVAVCEAIESVSGESAQIKWVNDVLIGGKKVCGILTEAAFRADGTVDFAVLGVGLNVYAPDKGFPDDIKDIAGAILPQRVAGGCDRLAAGFLGSFWRRYSMGCEYLDDYRRRCVVPGRRINVLRAQSSTPALALGIDDRCRLLVRYDDGSEEALLSGEISIRLAADN